MQHKPRRGDPNRMCRPSGALMRRRGFAIPGLNALGYYPSSLRDLAVTQRWHCMVKPVWSVSVAGLMPASLSVPRPWKGRGTLLGLLFVFPAGLVGATDATLGLGAVG